MKTGALVSGGDGVCDGPWMDWDGMEAGGEDAGRARE